MGPLSIRKISLLFSLLLLILSTILRIVIERFELSTWYTMGASLLLFLVIYMLLFRVLNYLLYKRIRPIYKIIRDLPLSKRKITSRDFVGDDDPINEVDVEVAKWANAKQEEIARLQGLEKYRKDFIGNVSHELKTPIFNIQGYIHTLLDGALEDPEINMMYLERTSKSVDRMISIVQDLEIISKLESGEIKLEKRRFDLVKLSEDVFEFEAREAETRQIKLILDAKRDVPVWVHADKGRIFNVISNLVINGIKYSKPGGEVRIAFFDMEDHILVEVSDNGIGITKENVHRIFERFYRVDKSRSRSQGGTGLGLAIVKHIIEGHKQTIQVRSVTGKGTKFNFTLDKSTLVK